MALDWEKSGKKVILLEGGGFGVEAQSQDLNAGENVGHKYYPLRSVRLRFFGGTMGHWGGWSSPFDPIDFVERNWIPDSGWPITKEELDPFYDRACKLVELPETSFDLQDYVDEKAGLMPLPLDETAVQMKMWQLSPPTRFGSHYREAIVNSGNIHLYTYAFVCDIKANESLKEITELEIRNHDGKKHRVRAKQFVLACGAMQNARLLLASNTQMRAGLGNQNDLVGRYFMEHIEVPAAKFRMPATRPMNLYRALPMVSKFFGEIQLTDEKQEELGILNGTCSLRSSDFTESPLGINNFPEDAAETIAIFDRWKKNAEEGEGNPELFGDDFGDIQEFFCSTRMEQSPNRNSRVMLSDQKDALGVPRTKFHWDLTELDRRSIRLFFETLGQEVGKANVARLWMRDWLRSDETAWPDYQGGGWHHMGTTRMHDDPKRGVTDKHCKVHGLANLHVAGSGNFTTGGAANPTLTIIALSLRLSDRLKELS